MHAKLWLALPALLYLFSASLPGCQQQQRPSAQQPTRHELCAGTTCTSSPQAPATRQHWRARI